VKRLALNIAAAVGLVVLGFAIYFVASAIGVVTAR